MNHLQLLVVLGINCSALLQSLYAASEKHFFLFCFVKFFFQYAKTVFDRLHTNLCYDSVGKQARKIGRHAGIIGRIVSIKEIQLCTHIKCFIN